MNKLRRFQNDRSCLYFRDTRDLGQLRKEGWSVTGQPVNDSVWGGVYFAGDRGNNQYLEAPADIEQYFKPQGNSDFTFFIRFVHYGTWDTTTPARHLFGTGQTSATNVFSTWSINVTSTTASTGFRVNTSDGTNLVVGDWYIPSQYPAVTTAILTRRNGVFESWMNGTSQGTLSATVDFAEGTRSLYLGGNDISTRSSKATVLSIGSWSRALMPEEIQALSNDSTFGYLPTLPSPINSDNSRLQTLELSEIQSSDFYLYPTGRLLPRLAGRERQYAIQDGVNSGIIVNDVGFLLNRPTSSMAYRMIFKPKRLMTTSDVLFRINGMAPSRALSVSGEVDSSIRFRIGDNAGNRSDAILGSTDVPIGAWSDVIFVVDRELGQTRLYLNGNLYTSNNDLANVGPIESRDYASLGSNSTASSNPALADVALFQTFNLVPSAEDIARMYRDPQWIKETWKWGTGNLLTGDNSTFDSSTGDWQANGTGALINRTDDQAHSGTHSLRVSVTGEATSENIGGRIIAASIPDLFGSVGSNTRVRISLWYFIESEGFRLRYDGTTSGVRRTDDITGPVGEWAYLEVESPDGLDLTLSSLRITGPTSGENYSVLIDNIEVEPLGTTCSLLPQNLTSSGWADASTNNYLGTLSSGTTLRIP